MSSSSIMRKRRAVSESSSERISPWLRYETSGPGSEGGEKTSTYGSFSRNFSAPRTPTRQPIRLMTRSGFCRFNGSSDESRPSALSSADWRTTHVFNTITSASSALSVKVYPRCSNDEPTRWESATFIWHPSVQIWYFIGWELYQERSGFDFHLLEQKLLRVRTVSEK